MAGDVQQGADGNLIVVDKATGEPAEVTAANLNEENARLRAAATRLVDAERAVAALADSRTVDDEAWDDVSRERAAAFDALAAALTTNP